MCYNDFMIGKFGSLVFYFTLLIAFFISVLAMTSRSFFEITPVADLTEIVNPHVEKPKVVRGIYLTASSAGNDKFRKEIINKMSESDINTVVIDIKDYSGYILYQSNVEMVKEIDAVKSKMDKIKKILRDFHNANIYVIARQTVFQDPVLAKKRPELALQTKNGGTWYDKSGLAWLDPQQVGVWEYNLEIAKEAAAIGFDEIQFDYMRYPSDGNIYNINYQLATGETKADVMNKFFAYLSQNLKGVTPISIDTFGLVMDHTSDNYDLNIGQLLNNIVDYFDYVSPMMYPSHYPLNYLGFSNSAEHPGEVISHGIEISKFAVSGKRGKIRPWLQAFHMGATYDKAKIDAQTKAVEKFDHTDGWILWNASNNYPDYIFE